MYKTTRRSTVAHLERHVDGAASHTRRRHPEAHSDLPGRLQRRAVIDAAAYEAREFAPVPRTTSQPRTNHKQISNRAKKPQQNVYSRVVLELHAHKRIMRGCGEYTHNTRVWRVCMGVVVESSVAE